MTRQWLADLPMWVVTAHPSDDPDNYVARLHRWSAGDNAYAATEETIRHPVLDDLRRELWAQGLYPIPRHAADDPVIIEVWL